MRYIVYILFLYVLIISVKDNMSKLVNKSSSDFHAAIIPNCIISGIYVRPYVLHMKMEDTKSAINF